MTSSEDRALRHAGDIATYAEEQAESRGHWGWELVAQMGPREIAEYLLEHDISNYRDALKTFRAIARRSNVR